MNEKKGGGDFVKASLGMSYYFVKKFGKISCNTVRTCLPRRGSLLQ